MSTDIDADVVRRGMGWELHEGSDRRCGADAGGNEAGGTEAVEERVGGGCVNGVSECGVAVEAGAGGEFEGSADRVVGSAREPRSQLGGKPAAPH